MDKELFWAKVLSCWRSLGALSCLDDVDDADDADNAEDADDSDNADNGLCILSSRVSEGQETSGWESVSLLDIRKWREFCLPLSGSRQKVSKGLSGISRGNEG
jgi:hypothetical protein